MNNLTQDNKISGYIIIIIHIIIVIFEIIYSIFGTVNILYILLLSFTFTIHFYIFIYYGGNGCILTRIERHLLNDKNWFGIFTIINIFFNINIEKNYGEILIINMWIILIIYIFYRIYSTYKLTILNL